MSHVTFTHNRAIGFQGYRGQKQLYHILSDMHLESMNLVKWGWKDKYENWLEIEGEELKCQNGQGLSPRNIAACC